MELSQAINLIAPAIQPRTGDWADLGAGTGLFTLALQALLERGTVYAVDKNPHTLWAIASTANVKVVVEEADFNKPLTLPLLEGIVMANALHYAAEPMQVLEHALACLKHNGTLVLVEYETNIPNFPWIPYPIPFARFEALTARLGLAKVTKIGTVPSIYGDEHIYAACAIKS